MKTIMIAATILLGSAAGIQAQDSIKTKSVTISGYAEVYYQFDNNRLLNNQRPSFVYSFNRNKEVALNLAYIKAAYKTENTRANISLAAGSYMNSNYAAESGVLKNIYEANVGIKLSRKSDLWLDAGIFPSHIGFESAIGKDCWNLTRSILADNSPYFEAGAKITYSSRNQKWMLSALLLNGWQRIQRIDGNSAIAMGTQVTYKPAANITLNSSTFVGNDKPDSVRQMRYFHNFYGIFQLNQKLAATLGFDIGAEQKTKGASAVNTWYSPVFILKYATGNKTALSARAEYYSDKNGVIIHTGTPNGFQTWGFSTNFDYSVTDNVVWRVEVKTMNNKDQIFYTDNGRAVKENTSVTASLAIGF